MKLPHLLLLLYCAVALPCLAQSRGAIRPVGKETKIVGLPKDHLVLARPYVNSERIMNGMTGSTTLPAGIYRATFEDDVGYYLPAPGKFVVKALGGGWKYEGGLFVRKDKPTVFYLYSVHPNTGKILPPDTRLPPEFGSLLR